MRRWGVIAGATCVGLLAGATVTIALRPGAGAPQLPARAEVIPVSEAAAPSTFLVWVPRGLPAGFAGRIDRMDKVAATTVVAEDDVWLRRSWSAAGELVDDPPPTYRIPIDAAAVDPATFATFVPPADRARIAALADGQAILGATSAGLRGLGPGAVLAIGDRRIRIAAVLPDELVGAAELVVSRRTGAP